jgi:hypothetical protein
MQATKIHAFNNGIEHYGVNKKIHESNLVLVIMFFGFQREINHT